MSEQYKPNSKRYKESQDKDRFEKDYRERQKLDKVVRGTVKTKKKSEVQKFADVFISEDVANVKSFIVMDVLVPATKKLISDIVTNGLDMILYGATGFHRSSTTRADKISYVEYSNQRHRDRRFDDYRSSRPGYSYDDITLESRGEAQEVLTRMDELIETYGMATVADLYDLIGKSSNYTDCKYGWTNLRNAEAVRVRDGYKLKLPKALPINN